MGRRRSAMGSLPAPLMTSSYQAGAVHTQYSYDSFGDATAVAAGKVLLRNATDAENQHIMGFGTTSPEVSNGVRDYVASNLTARVNTVMSGAATKVITFALAPAWCREVPSGVTPIDDFSPEAWYYAPPQAQYVDEFAALCADIAATYTDTIYFIVWNEMKGLFDSTNNVWDFARYTTMYNAIWSAVKAARPDAKIGGPYTNIGSGIGNGSPVQSPLWGSWVDGRLLDVMTYWLANKTGADFAVIDGGNYTAGGATASEFGKFKSYMAWFRGLNNTTYPGAATLPLWIAEHYCYPPGASTTENNTDVPRYPAEWAVGTIEAIRAGYATTMLWGPQGVDNTNGLSYPLGLSKDTRVSGGGGATVLHPVVKDFHDNYQAGTPIYIPATGNSNIVSIGNTTKCTLINRAGTSQATSGMIGVASQQTLTAYEVRTVTWSPVGYVQATDPTPGPLWTDDFTATTNLAVKRGSVTAVSGKLRGGSTSSANMVTAPAAYDTPNHYAQVVVSTITNASSEVGVGLRFDTAGTRYYLGLIKASGAVELYYFNGTSYTLLTSGSVTLGTLPGTLRGEVDSAGSNNLRLYWRGTLAIQTTHSTLTTGMPTTYEYPVSSVANVELDSWEADLL